MTSSTSAISWPGRTAKRRGSLRTASYSVRLSPMSWLQPRRPHSQTKAIRPSAGSARIPSLILRYVASLIAICFWMASSTCPHPFGPSGPSVRVEREPHEHPGAVATLLDLQLVADARDEREPHSQPRTVRARRHPGALVGDDHPRPAVLDGERHPDAPRLIHRTAIAIRVHNDVRDRLRDRQLDRGNVDRHRRQDLADREPRLRTTRRQRRQLEIERAPDFTPTHQARNTPPGERDTRTRLSLK